MGTFLLSQKKKQVMMKTIDMQRNSSSNNTQKVFPLYNTCISTTISLYIRNQAKPDEHPHMNVIYNGQLAQNPDMHVTPPPIIFQWCDWNTCLGHTYSWKNPTLHCQSPEPDVDLFETEEPEEPNEPDVNTDLQPMESKDKTGLGLDDRENEFLGDEDSDSDDLVEGAVSEGKASDDE